MVIAQKHIAFAAGGTGGHVYPALAIISALLKRPSPPRILFFGRQKGLERDLVEPLPVNYVGLSMIGFPRKVSFRWLSAPLLTLFSFCKAVWTLVNRRPDLVVGFGSYVAFPVILAALILGIPTLIHEQNTFPGMANRMLAPWVKKVLVSNADCIHRLRRSDCTRVGVPLRDEVIDGIGNPEALGLNKEQRALLIFGGSQGARRIGEVVIQALRLLENRLKNWQVLLITGPKNFDWVSRERLPKNVIVKGYVDAMGAVYPVTTLAIARAGAVSLAELTANGIPSVLIPLPTATGGHQLHNAKMLESHGAAVVIEQSQLTAEKLAAVVGELVSDSSRLQLMATAARSLGQPEATEKFIGEMEALLG